MLCFVQFDLTNLPIIWCNLSKFVNFFLAQAD